MKKALIAAVAATSMIAGIGAAQADGTDPFEAQNFKDRGAISQSALQSAPFERFAWDNARYAQSPMNGGFGDSLEN